MSQGCSCECDAAEDLQADKEVVLAAVAQDGDALLFAKPRSAQPKPRSTPTPCGYS